MENSNTTPATATNPEGKLASTQEKAENGQNQPADDNNVTMTKDELNKAIQAAEDRVRTKYSKDIKALEDKIKELTPVKKTEAELEFEKRLAELERKEKENEEKAQLLSLKGVLQSHAIDAEFADYLKEGTDAKKFSDAIERLVSARMAAGGYKPTGHQNNQPITKKEYDALTYEEKAELFRRDPEIRKRLK